MTIRLNVGDICRDVQGDLYDAKSYFVIKEYRQEEATERVVYRVRPIVEPHAEMWYDAGSLEPTQYLDIWNGRMH